MAINAVASSASALQQQVASERQPEVQSSERASQATSKRAEGASEAENVRPERPERPERAERPEAPKPVVNAQGQKTGTIINTTA